MKGIEPRTVFGAESWFASCADGVARIRDSEDQAAICTPEETAVLTNKAVHTDQHVTYHHLGHAPVDDLQHRRAAGPAGTVQQDVFQLQVTVADALQGSWEMLGCCDLCQSQTACRIVYRCEIMQFPDVCSVNQCNGPSNGSNPSR